MSLGHIAAYVDATAEIGDDVEIGHHVYIGPKVIIGDHCRIQSGAVIGAEGFGYRHTNGRWQHRKHTGGVVIADDVHVGANTNIHAGTVQPTVIGPGTRIDALVHVAHNVRIGHDCVIVAGAEISGSCRLDDGCWIGPKACIHQHTMIGARALVGMGAVVLADVPADQTWAGTPARCINATVGVREQM